MCYLDIEMFTKDFIKINLVGSQINLNMFKRLLAWDNVTQGKITERYLISQYDVRFC